MIFSILHNLFINDLNLKEEFNFKSVYSKNNHIELDYKYIRQNSTILKGQ